MTRRELVKAVAGFLAASSAGFGAVEPVSAAEPVLMIAVIPMPVWWELKRLGVAMDPRRMKEWLDLPENRVFLVAGRE